MIAAQLAFAQNFALPRLNFRHYPRQQALEMRHSMERLFMVGVFGDMLGVPILPPYYGLRLLPWVVPQIETWKRQVLRERELGSDHEHHLHGL